MKSKITGIERIPKLMSQHPNKDDIKITTAQFDDIMKTVNYHMSNFCGYDIVLDEMNDVIAYVKGRDYNSNIYLTKNFATKIKLIIE